tara:strand:+ start:3299 stop:4873 length:1575 start_codon:yes stop_codon:yes gene_type:complete
MTIQINGLRIIGSEITVDYTNSGTPTPGPAPTPGPDPAPSSDGKCVSLKEGYTSCDSDCKTLAWCPTGCKKECCENIYGGGFCKWQPGDPCASNPCKNGGKCKTSADKSNYSCSCPPCYTGTTCETIKSNSGCKDGEGCTITPDGDKCVGKCESEKCYTINPSTKKCELCQGFKCDNGLIARCDNGTCKCVKGLPDKVLIGYWGSNSSPDLINAIEKGKYNVIMFTFGAVTQQGEFNLCTDIVTGCSGASSRPLDKDISYITKNNIPAFISIFGANGLPPASYDGPASVWSANVISSLKKKYPWVTGIDLDLENTWGSDKTTEYIYELFVEAKRQGYYTSMAPQTTSLDPSINIYAFQNAGSNAYYPFITGDNINTWDLICPQLYNNNFAGGRDISNAITYSKLLLSKTTLKYNGGDTNPSSLWKNGLVNNNFSIKIPINKLVLGFPSSGCACKDDTSCKTRGSTTNTCGNDYKPVSDVEKIYNEVKVRGIMTWSIGWDNYQGKTDNDPDTYKFGKGVSNFLGL